MTEETWRPLGVDTEEDVAAYDALHDGVPEWMRDAYWEWVRRSLSTRQRTPGGSYSSGHFVAMLDCPLAERMCQVLKIPFPNLRKDYASFDGGKRQLANAVSVLVKHPHPLQIADYLLAHGIEVDGAALDGVLTRAKSAWTVGSRAGKPGLVRRVPLGVQVAADAVIANSGMAGVRLAKAWKELYGIEPNASAAYGLAIKAVEDAAVPVVSPKNSNATLGSVLAQMEDQGDWKFPMDREHAKAPSKDVLTGMMRMLWHGQHDRHGGQPSAPGNVSMEEATVAVSLAVTIVNLFSAALVARP